MCTLSWKKGECFSAILTDVLKIEVMRPLFLREKRDLRVILTANSSIFAQCASIFSFVNTSWTVCCPCWLCWTFWFRSIIALMIARVFFCGWWSDDDGNNSFTQKNTTTQRKTALRFGGVELLLLLLLLLFETESACFLRPFSLSLSLARAMCDGVRTKVF